MIQKMLNQILQLIKLDTLMKTENLMPLFLKAAIMMAMKSRIHKNHLAVSILTLE